MLWACSHSFLLGHQLGLTWLPQVDLAVWCDLQIKENVGFGVLQIWWEDGTGRQGWGAGRDPGVLFFSSLPFF